MDRTLEFTPVNQEQSPRRQAWGGFFGWLVAGALLGLSIAGAASIGLLILPFAVLVIIIMLVARAPGRSAFGLLAGIGVLALFLGVLSLGYTPCDDAGTLVDGEIVFGYTQEGDPNFDGETSCGGWSPLPFLAAGAGLTTAGVGLFVRSERRSRQDELADAPPNLAE